MDRTEAETLARAVETLRGDLSPTEFAKLVGVDAKTISRLEKAESSSFTYSTP